MIGCVCAALGFLAGLPVTAVTGMASQEIRERLARLPYAILCLAARRLDPSYRATVYQDRWRPVLTCILEVAEARPITRLITGSCYALAA